MAVLTAFITFVAYMISPVLIQIIIRAAITRKAARKSGILGIKRTFAKAHSICCGIAAAAFIISAAGSVRAAAEYASLIKEAETKGVSAYVEYEEWNDSIHITDGMEDSLAEKLKKDYTAKIISCLGNILWYALFAAMYTAGIFMFGSYITNEGVYFSPSDKYPADIIIFSEGGQLRFFAKRAFGDSLDPGQEPFFVCEDSPGNRERFAALLASDNGGAL